MGWEGYGHGGVSGAENVGMAQGDVEEESPRKGVCRGGDVEGLREQSLGGTQQGEAQGRGCEDGGGAWQREVWGRG